MVFPSSSTAISRSHRDRGDDRHGVLSPRRAKQLSHQLLTHCPHSQASRGAGYWGFLADLPILAKLLANWLRDSIDALISPFQSVFIPGQQMADSVVLARETVAAWKCRGTTSFFYGRSTLPRHRLLGLAVLMDRALAKGFSRGVNTMGQAMRHHPLLFSLDGWPPTGGGGSILNAEFDKAAP